MLILNHSFSSLKKAAKFLKEEKLVAFPTETVYGVGARYDSLKVFKTLNQLKGERTNKPYTLMLADIKDIKKFAKIDPKTYSFIKKILPGPVTILVKVKPNLKPYLSKNGYIGIRVPDYKLATSLIKLSGPLLVTSLNRSNKLPMSDVNKIKKEFKDELSALIKMKIKKAKPSTVILISDKIKVIREGNIPSKKLIEVYRKL